MNERPVEKYAGIIKAPESWWLSTSRWVYKAWDLPDGWLRNMILQEAREIGILHELGPSSMSTREVLTAVNRILGGDDAIPDFKPLTQTGRDFLTETGGFTPDPEKN